MYALARRFTGRPAALVAGFLYAFCLTRYESLPHLHMLGVQYLPLMLFATDRWLDRARSSDGFLLSASLTLQSLSSIYLAYALAIAYIPSMVVFLLRRRRELDRRRMVGLVVAGMVASGVFLAASIPYMKLRSLGLFPSYGDQNKALGLMPYFTAFTVSNYLKMGGVGVVGYALALVAVLAVCTPLGGTIAGLVWSVCCWLLPERSQHLDRRSRSAGW